MIRVIESSDLNCLMKTKSLKVNLNYKISRLSPIFIDDDNLIID